MPSNKERKGRWQPFDALSGYQKSLREVEKTREKIEKPVLFPDKIEELNYTIKRAIDEGFDALLSYYKDGFIEEVRGKISRLDLASKTLNIASMSIAFNLIIDIKEVDDE